MTIKEVSERFGVSTDTLRYYAKNKQMYVFVVVP